MSERENVLPYAKRAFSLAVAGDMGAAFREVEACAEAGESIPEMAVLWIDTTLAAQGVTEFTDQVAGTKLMNVDEGEARYVDGSQPPHAVWGSRLYTARARGDEDMWNAVWDSTPDDAWGLHIGTLLQSMAMTYRLVTGERTGRALDCTRCNWHLMGDTPRHLTACSCLIHCGAYGCTGTRQTKEKN